jgi:predicted nucleic acid-binding protein
MKVLLDMNVVLDVLLVRQPWFPEASQVWDANLKGQIAAGIAAFTVPTVFYVIRRQTDLSRAQDAVRVCLTSFIHYGVSPCHRGSAAPVQRPV